MLKSMKSDVLSARHVPLRSALGRRQADGSGVIQTAGYTFDRYNESSQAIRHAGLERERAGAGCARGTKGSCNTLWQAGS